MGDRARVFCASTLAAAALALSGCGGAAAGSAEPAPNALTDDAVDHEGATPGVGAATPTSEPEPEPSPWLTRLQEEGMLTFRVDAPDHPAPVEVRVLVQQRVSRAGNVAVRLVPIGTPLGETPIYPQWLIGTPDGMSALDEGAAFTTPGFVPIDERGRLRTEASANEVWRVEARWLRAGGAASGGEVAVGWALEERVGAIEEPIAADDCVRLERSDDTVSTTLLVCAGLGVVERVERVGDEVRSRWQLIAVGERPTELE